MAREEPERIGFLWYSVTHWPYRHFYTPEFLAPEGYERTKVMGRIRGFFLATKADKEAESRPSRMWEILHPRKAEALWAALEEEADLLIEHEAAEAGRDRAYQEYLTDREYGMGKGNPPDSRLLDEEIERLSAQYREVSDPEIEQDEFEAQAFERGPRLSYPEYEGPGFTEPPVDWEGWHEDHPGWTFTEWAEARGWSPDYVVEINAEFPSDEAEAEYTRERDERERQRVAEWERSCGPEPADDPSAVAIDEGRFVPTDYDLGITDEPEDECDGTPDQREIIATNVQVTYDHTVPGGRVTITHDVPECEARSEAAGHDDPYAIAISEGRFVPTSYDLGITDEPERETASNPYDQWNHHGVYWPQREAGQL